MFKMLKNIYPSVETVFNIISIWLLTLESDKTFVYTRLNSRSTTKFDLLYRHWYWVFFRYFPRSQYLVLPSILLSSEKIFCKTKLTETIGEIKFKPILREWLGDSKGFLRVEVYVLQINEKRPMSRII